MTKISILFLVLSLCLFTCKNDKKKAKNLDDKMVVKEEKTDTSKKLKIALNAKSNSSVSGNAVFKEENGMVTLTAIIEGLEPGKHAIHIHEKADCTSDDGSSAGGHWNPTAQPHGKWGDAKGYHKGDIGNFTADENGNGTITFSTDQWCMGCEDNTKNIIGKSLIVHAGADDFTSQPSGAAGTRVSCAGIIE